MECPWPIDIETCCKDAGVEPDDERVEQVIAQVSQMLSRWSGYAYGGCKTVRPLEPCGQCRSGCCAQGDCIVLHQVSAVVEVRVDGEVVPPSDWHYDPTRGTLCTAPGERWPFADPRSSAVGTMEVDASVGAEPDDWALQVAATLACELLRSCTGARCRLPRNATQVNAQGITVTLSEEAIKHMLPEVSSWVSTVNPRGAVRPTLLFSPEADRAAVVGRRGDWGNRSSWR